MMTGPIDYSAMLSWRATRTPIQDLMNVEVALFDGVSCARFRGDSPQRNPSFSVSGASIFAMSDWTKHRLMGVLSFNRNPTSGE